eukprot:jgi/Ulvmu1/6496/UM003_0129.1
MPKAWTQSRRWLPCCPPASHNRQQKRQLCNWPSACSKKSKSLSSDCEHVQASERVCKRCAWVRCRLLHLASGRLLSSTAAGVPCSVLCATCHSELRQLQAAQVCEFRQCVSRPGPCKLAARAVPGPQSCWSRCVLCDCSTCAACDQSRLATYLLATCDPSPRPRMHAATAKHACRHREADLPGCGRAGAAAAAAQRRSQHHPERVPALPEAPCGRRRPAAVVAPQRAQHGPADSPRDVPLRAEPGQRRHSGHVCAGAARAGSTLAARRHGRRRARPPAAARCEGRVLRPRGPPRRPPRRRCKDPGRRRGRRASRAATCLHAPGLRGRPPRRRRRPGRHWRAVRLPRVLGGARHRHAGRVPDAPLRPRARAAALPEGSGSLASSGAGAAEV